MKLGKVKFNNAAALFKNLPVRAIIRLASLAGLLVMVAGLGAYNARRPERQFKADISACTTPGAGQSTISLTATNANEENERPGRFTFTRSRVSANPLAVSFTVKAESTATVWEDYEEFQLPSWVTIAANQASASLEVRPYDDAIVDPNETIIIAVEPSSDYRGAPEATMRIIDNDGASVMRLPASAEFLANLSSRLSQTVVVESVSASEPTTGEICGTVTDAATGQRLSGITLSLILSSGPNRSYTTNSDGGYSFSNLNRQLLYDLLVNGPADSNSIEEGVNGISLSNEAVRVFDFTLTQGGRLSGRVTSLQSGLPIANVAVEALSSQRSSSGQAVTDANGQFKIEPLALTTEYTFRALPSVVSGYEEVVTNEGYRPTRDGISIVLPGDGQIRGLVDILSVAQNSSSTLDTNVEIIDGALIRIIAADGSLNIEGITPYEFHNQPTGEYRLQLISPPANSGFRIPASCGNPCEKSFTLIGGSNDPVTISLDPPDYTEGYLKDIKQWNAGYKAAGPNCNLPPNGSVAGCPQIIRTLLSGAGAGALNNAKLSLKIIPQAANTVWSARFISQTIPGLRYVTPVRPAGGNKAEALRTVYVGNYTVKNYGSARLCLTVKKGRASNSYRATAPIVITQNNVQVTAANTETKPRTVIFKKLPAKLSTSPTDNTTSLFIDSANLTIVTPISNC